MDFTRGENDRRNKYRFAIQREVRYKMANDGIVVATGSGQTINIGSGGVAFMAQHTLTPGSFVELSISWPVLLGDTCPMRLIAFGRILRCTGQKAVCTIDKYEFRTQARTIQAPVASRSDGMLQRWADGIRKETLRSNMVRA